MRYVFALLIALIVSWSASSFAHGQSSGFEKAESVEILEDHSPLDASSQQMQSRSVLENSTNEVEAQIPVYQEVASLRWLETNNVDYASGGQLVISNVPFDVCLEIDGSFYRHNDKSGMKYIVVDGFASYQNQKLVRTGRTPQAINSTDAKVAAVQLLSDQAVYLDWTREFRSLDYQADKSKRVFSQASMTAVTRPTSSMPVAIVSANIVQDSDDCLLYTSPSPRD